MYIMMPLDIKGLEKEWSLFMTLYQDDIKASWDIQWNNEDIFGECKNPYKVLQYIAAFYYVMLIRKDNILFNTNSNLEDKFELNKYRRLFACNNIDIDAIYNLIKTVSMTDLEILTLKLKELFDTALLSGSFTATTKLIVYDPTWGIGDELKTIYISTISEDIVGASGTITPVVRTNNPVVALNLPNVNIDLLDAAIGADNVPVIRTNNPTIANTTINAKVQALDTAIGANPTPVIRTNNPVVVNTTLSQKVQALDNAIGNTPVPLTRTISPILSTNDVIANIEALDAAIGPNTDMVAPVMDVSVTYSMIQNFSEIDKRKSIRSTEFIIGWSGAAACDYVFASNNDKILQGIELGTNIVPAYGRVIDFVAVVTETFTGSAGAEFFSIDVGNAVGFGQYVTGGAINDAGDSTALVTTFPLTVVVTATKIYFSGTPTTNKWNQLTAGKIKVFITYNDVSGLV